MTSRYLVLVVAAVAVLGLGVYLFFEVRSAPAAVTVVPSHKDSPPPPVQAREETHGDVTPGTPRHVPAPPSEPPPSHGGNAEVNAPQLQASAAADDRANPKLDAIMDEANKAYDTQDFDQAKDIAQKVLATQPGNVRMLRIMVSSSCIDGDKDTAQKYFAQLPKPDRDQMKLRCARYSITLNE